jgi:hypothetical protein
VDFVIDNKDIADRLAGGNKPITGHFCLKGGVGSGAGVGLDLNASVARDRKGNVRPTNTFEGELSVSGLGLAKGSVGFSLDADCMQMTGVATAGVGPLGVSVDTGGGFTATESLFEGFEEGVKAELGAKLVYKHCWPMPVPF